MKNYTGEQLRKIILDSGVSQRRLAKNMGISAPGLSKILKSEKPRPETINKIIDSLKDIVGDKKEYTLKAIESESVTRSDRNIYGNKTSGLAEQLKILSELFRDGFLSEKEFEKAKKILIK
jgi:transcriptional regulator with XRE-family HTH domain